MQEHRDFCNKLQLLRLSNKHLKNTLMLLVTKLLLKKQALLEMINKSLKKLTHIKHFRDRSKVKFLVNVIVGMSATALISLHMAPSVLPAISYRTSWIGNTFGGGSKWVQNFIDGMYVASDGTVYTNSGWDEAGREVGIYKNGDVIGKASELHGWGRGGGGKRFLYLTDMYATRLYVYRFDGEIAVPCAIFAQPSAGDWPAGHPATGRWLWRDLNGNGSIQSDEYQSLGNGEGTTWAWDVDSKGDVWLAVENGPIRRYRVQGLDAYGSLIYNSAAADSISMPAPFQKLERLKYFPSTDVMYVGGYTRQRPHTGSEWGIVGTEMVRYDNWSTTKNVRWRVALPYQTAAEPIRVVKAMDVAGDRVFAVDSRTAVVYVYDAATGASVTTLKPGLEVKSESGMIDIPYGLRAYRRANGKYLVFVEEDAKAKIIMYRYPV